MSAPIGEEVGGMALQLPSPPLLPRPAVGIADPALMVEYTFQLRPGLFIEQRLPMDLTQGDVDRLYKWLDSLPVE